MIFGSQKFWGRGNIFHDCKKCFKDRDTTNNSCSTAYKTVLWAKIWLLYL